MDCINDLFVSVNLEYLIPLSYLILMFLVNYMNSNHLVFIVFLVFQIAKNTNHKKMVISLLKAL